MSLLKLDTDIQVSEEFYNTCKQSNYNINDFPKIIKDLEDTEPLNILKGLVGLRKLYVEEKEKDEPKQIFDKIDILFNLLENFPEEFKYESLYCLICIETINLKLYTFIEKEPTQKIIHILLHILYFPKKVKYELLDLNLKYICLLVKNKQILKKFNEEKIYLSIKNIIEKEFLDDTNIIANCLNVFDNILEYEESTQNFNKFSKSILLLDNLITKFPSNKDILDTSLKILSILTNQEKKNDITISLNAIIELNMLPKFIKYAGLDNVENNENQIFYSLRVIGNFCEIDDGYYTDKIIEVNGLDVLKKLLQKEYSFKIRKESAWIISNIAAGTESQLIKLYENKFQDVLFDIILNGEENELKENCLWALYNFSNIKNKDYLEAIIEKGFIDIIINRFKIDKGNVLGLSLEALCIVMRYGKKKDPANYNIIENKVNELNVLNEIKNVLKQNSEEIVSKKSKIILNDYFRIEDIDQFLKEEKEEKK